jgi:hypothetical protein
MNVRALIGEADNGWVVEVPGRALVGLDGPRVLSESGTRVAHNGTELLAVLRDVLGLVEGPPVPVVWAEAFSTDDHEWQALIEGAAARAHEHLREIFEQEEARPPRKGPGSGELLVF